MVTYLKKEEIYPFFGLAKNGQVFVQEGLPKKVNEFVIEHEQYHITDMIAKWWVWREIKANCYAGIRHPVGFFHTLYLTLSSWDRIKLYIKRSQDGI